MYSRMGRCMVMKLYIQIYVLNQYVFKTNKLCFAGLEITDYVNHTDESCHIIKALADLHAKFSGASPLRDPILSFLHIMLYFQRKVPTSEVHGPKRVHVPLRENLDLRLLKGT